MLALVSFHAPRDFKTGFLFVSIFFSQIVHRRLGCPMFVIVLWSDATVSSVSDIFFREIREAMPGKPTSNAFITRVYFGVCIFTAFLFWDLAPDVAAFEL